MSLAILARKSEAIGPSKAPAPSMTESNGLRVGDADSAFEREADRVADEIMASGPLNWSLSRMSIGTPPLQRKCDCGGSGKCDACEQGKTVQRKAAGAFRTGEAPSTVHEVLRSLGRPLDQKTRTFFESRFGYDFSNIRIHVDAPAAESARAVNAVAYTVGDSIAFGTGHYSPQTIEGRRLIAHELAHSIQQTGRIRALGGSSANYSSGMKRLAARSDESGASTGLLARQAKLGRVSQPILQRECLSGNPCNPPIAGAPGQYAAQATAAEAPARAARATEAPADTQASGHGRRATNLEHLARDAGYDQKGIYGVFVDKDIETGGWTRLCKDFVGFVPPYSGDATAKCIFVPDDFETGAELFYRDSKANAFTIRGSRFDRDTFKAAALQVVAHELGHVSFGAATHRTVASAGCPRTTEIYRSGSKVYNLDFYLSELTAIMREFPPLYRTAIRGSQAVRNYVQTWFNYKVVTAAESIKGILTALRCKCDCKDVDAYVRDTFIMAAGDWTQGERNFFNYVMTSWPGINWPLQSDPICIDRCEENFKACLNTGGRFDSPEMRCLAQRSTCFGFCQRDGGGAAQQPRMQPLGG